MLDLFMRELIICENPEALAVRAADSIIEVAREAIAARGRFVLALCGGSTPEKTYRLLGQSERAAIIDWSKTIVFFGDERFVPLTDPRSNYRMAQEALLAHVPIPAAQVYPVPTAQSDAAKAAEAYQGKLLQVFAEWGSNCLCETIPLESEPGRPGPRQDIRVKPRFDLILLGLGADGHTASLFSGAAALKAANAWVTWSRPGSLPPPVDRITFTYPLLNAARHVMFLVSGIEKAAILRMVLEGNASPEIYPAAGVCPDRGRLTWFVDRPAATRLTPDIVGPVANLP
jgi:6-phosphogluconolactonase